MLARIRFISTCVFVLALLLTPGGPSIQSAPAAISNTSDLELAQVASTPFSVSPDPVIVQVPLGQTQQITLTLENISGSNHTTRLYEANPVPPDGVVARQVVPETLRRVSLPDQAARVDGQISRDLAATADGHTDFVVFLDEQPDLAAAYDITDWGERGRFVVRTLYENAEDSQRDLRTWLEDRGLPYQPFWIANAIAVRGDIADVQALARRDDVALLRANHVVSIGEDPTTAAVPALNSAQRNIPSGCQPNGTNICWNIRKIGADRAWYDFGVSGAGITVANIDSGVLYDHPALIEQYRGYDGSSSFNHEYNLFDPQGMADDPMVLGDHGTHTMGTMVARGTTNSDQPAVGVAPGATWIAARGCQERSCSEIDLMASAQWLLNPTDADGQNPRPDLRPHIINNSWTDNDGGNQKYAGYTTAWRAAGIFSVFAAGNNRHTTCSTVTSPGDYMGVVGAGATDQNDQLAGFSSIGPSVEGELKPDITAPGQGIVSTYAESGLSYGTSSGTSMAAPHVAGTVALMWSTNPTLIGDYDTTYAMLTQSALERTDSNFSGPQYALCGADSTPNNVYGYGRVDAYAAVAQATVDVPWLELSTNTGVIEPGGELPVTLTLNAGRVPGPGTYNARILVHTDDLSQSPLVIEVELVAIAVGSEATVNGTIRDQTTSQPLAGTVIVTNGPTIDVDETGNFTMVLLARPEPYEFTVQSIGYVSETTELTLIPVVASTLQFSLTTNLPALQATPELRTATLAFGETADFVTVVENSGSQPLDYTLEVPSEWFGMWRSDEVGGPGTNWIEPPPNRVILELADDGSSEALPLGFSFPLYGKLVDELYLSANGFLSRAPLPASQPFRYGCLPIPETFTAAIAPFRADLDPAQGGTVSYAQLGNRFLVTFEDVPLHDLPDQRFTFQVVLHQDGRVFFNYKQLSDVPRSVAVGLQRDAQDAQIIGCGQESSIFSGLTIEMRPQPNAQFWLDVPESAGTIPPGQQAELTMRVNWIGSSVTQPYKSAVVLESNDPRNAQLRLPVELSTTSAPYELRFPLAGHTAQP